MRPARSALPKNHKTPIRKPLFGRQPEAGNRLLKEDKQERRQRQALRWWLTLAVLIGGAVTWLIIWSGYLDYQTLDIQGNQILSAEEVRGAVDSFLTGRKLYVIKPANLLFISGRRLQQALLAQLPLTAATISKDWWQQRLIVKIVEKQYNYIWQEGSNFFYITRGGDVVIRGDTPTSSLPLIVNATSSLLVDRQVQIDPSFLDAAGQLSQDLSSTRGLSQYQLVYDHTPGCIKVQVVNGPLILFSTRGSLEQQLVKLETVRRHELSDGRLFNSQHYIDLRFGDKVFYQ